MQYSARTRYVAFCSGIPICTDARFFTEHDHIGSVTPVGLSVNLSNVIGVLVSP